MLRVNTDESFWEYCGRENFLVIPITKYVRKDGSLVLVEQVSKEAATRHPDLQKIWGYLTSNNVQTPTYRRSGVNLIGLPDRDHYASKIDPEIVEQSLYLVREVSEDNPSYVFYLYGFLGGEEFREMNERVLSSDRFVVLFGENHD